MARPPAKTSETINVDGRELFVQTRGDRNKPTLVLIHGFPSSSASFRNVIEPLSKACFVIAPDLPGFGRSQPIDDPSFSRFADVLEKALAHLDIESFHLYLHDYGAAVALHLATRAPHRVRSLIVQNANAHRSGMGPQWAATQAYWDDPTPENEAKATSHLDVEGVRYQYVGDIPDDIARRVDPGTWKEDWRVMSLPGRLDMHRALVLDYRNHAARFDEIAGYLEREQPPALMLWGRHDVFFAIDETLSWMKDLPRMEAHILDGPHFLLETHAAQCAALMAGFIDRVERQR